MPYKDPAKQRVNHARWQKANPGKCTAITDRYRRKAAAKKKINATARAWRKRHPAKRTYYYERQLKKEQALTALRILAAISIINQQPKHETKPTSHNQNQRVRCAA